MYVKNEFRFFNQDTTVETLENCCDFQEFKQRSLQLMTEKCEGTSVGEWILFAKHLDASSFSVSEKLLIMKTAFHCLKNKIIQGEFAQLLSLSKQLKEVSGQRLLHILFTAKMQTQSLELSHYLILLQLLLELHDSPHIVKIVRQTLPDHQLLMEKLDEMRSTLLKSRYPERNLDETLQRFSQVDFPLAQDELQIIKNQCVQYQKTLQGLKNYSLLALKAALMGADKIQLLAIFAETLKKIYKIEPYDTQIIALFALIHRPENLKGRIAQIKTGEGKSTIIAMLIAYMALHEGHDYFVNMVTSSRNLAMRDSQKFRPFFEALGLSVSHIGHEKPQREHFQARILYGTNEDFEFAYMYDGLKNTKFLYSFAKNGELVPRTHDVVIVDEVDNLFIDTALSSAKISLSVKDNNTWIYPLILNFIPSLNEVENRPVEKLRQHILQQVDREKQAILKEYNDDELMQLIKSAVIALHKVEDIDYSIKTTLSKKEVVIVDFENTGRHQIASQWSDGIHQFVEAINGLKITPSGKIGASLSHISYFNFYKIIIGLTGTMGEAIERKEVEKNYHLQSFDVPTHFVSLRKQEKDYILFSKKEKWEVIYKTVTQMQKQEKPALILFKTIKESNRFSQYLKEKNCKLQLINEQQKENEDYLIVQAGEAGTITCATNTACRGTDIILSEKSKQAGGLLIVFTFYPRNLRVEGQGAGRSGRQGQPGSHCMILDAKEITTMFKDNLAFLLQLAIFLEIQKTAQTFMDPQVILKEMHALRTKDIENESRQRSISAEKEKGYFEKLSAFFTFMQKIHALMDDKVFEKKLKDHCKSEPPFGASVTEMDESRLLHLKEMAILLRENQERGVNVDWTDFLKQFKKAIVDNILDLWANYYSHLREPHGMVKAEKAYKDLMPYFVDPQKTIINLLGALIHAEEIQQISIQTCF